MSCVSSLGLLLVIWMLGSLSHVQFHFPMTSLVAFDHYQSSFVLQLTTHKIGARSLAGQRKSH